MSELVDHFKDPKERIEKWRAEKERAEERIAALKVRKKYFTRDGVVKQKTQKQLRRGNQCNQT